MRLLSYVLLFLSLCVSIAWFVVNQEEVRTSLHDYVENGDFLTLEARYTPEQILALHRREMPILPCSTPHLQFYPYLLLEVKYLDAQIQTQEGMILWNLADGEMVLDTETWEKTRGFQDCIYARATAEDYQLLHTLAEYPRGCASIQQLERDFPETREKLSKWIHNAEKRHLVIQQGDLVQLHFQNPKLWVTPATHMRQSFVTKPLQLAQRIPKRFTRGQVQRSAELAFGKGFAVRQATEIFLPVYTIETYNPDGTTQISYWNALNGQKVG